MRRLPGAHQHIALVPQWDLLDLLADAAGEEPTFTLRRNAEARELLWDGHRVAGVRYVDRETGAEHELRASVTVACDGRGSAVRAAAGLRPRSFGVPMDVWWFRLPRHADDPPGGVGRFTTGHFCVLIDRGDYWQCAYLIRKGSDAALRAAGIEELRHRFATLLPWLGDRVDSLQSWDDVRLLDVRLERLRRWYRDGLLLIGDAAHAMSPVGGVGINLAVQDAVAAARVLGARAGVRRNRPALGAAPGAAPPVVADRADPGLPAAGPPRGVGPGAPHRSRRAERRAQRRTHSRIRHRAHRRTPGRASRRAHRRAHPRVRHRPHRRTPGRADRRRIRYRTNGRARHRGDRRAPCRHGRGYDRGAAARPARAAQPVPLAADPPGADDRHRAAARARARVGPPPRPEPPAYAADLISRRSDPALPPRRNVANCVSRRVRNADSPCRK